MKKILVITLALVFFGCANVTILPNGGASIQHLGRVKTSICTGKILITRSYNSEGKLVNVSGAPACHTVESKGFSSWDLVISALSTWWGQIAGLF